MELQRMQDEAAKRMREKKHQEELQRLQHEREQLDRELKRQHELVRQLRLQQVINFMMKQIDKNDMFMYAFSGAAS